MSKDCNPLPAVSLAAGEMYRLLQYFLCEDGRHGQHHLVARQSSAAQLLPEIPRLGQHALLAFLAPVLLCAWAFGKRTT